MPNDDETEKNLRAWDLVILSSFELRVSSLQMHLDLRSLALLGKDLLVELHVLSHDVANGLLDAFKSGGFILCAVSDLDEVQAEVRDDDVADIAFFHGKGGLGKRLDHDELVGEGADIAPLVFAGAIGVFLGGLGEVELAGRD